MSSCYTKRLKEGNKKGNCTERKIEKINIRAEISTLLQREPGALKKDPLDYSFIFFVEKWFLQHI